MLVPWHGSTVIGTVVKTLKECGLEVLVVTGRDHEQVSEASGVETVFNPDYESGLGSSIACGSRLCDDADGILIVLGDVPYLLPEDLTPMLAAFSIRDQIIVSRYPNGRLAPPVLFGAAYLSDLQGLSGDQGAKYLLDKHPDKVTEIDMRRLPDIDYPDDIAGTSDR